MRHQQADVLITYAWCRTSYQILRSLKRLGLRVAVADDRRTGLCQFSRLPDARVFHRPYADPGFVDDLLDACRRLGVVLIIPSHEELFALAPRMREFSDLGVTMHVARPELLDELHDKLTMTLRATERGVSAPRTWLAGDVDQRVINDGGGQLILKPRRANGSAGVVLGPTLEQCVSAGRDAVVQQIVPGVGVGVSMLYWNGRRVMTFTHRRTATRFDFGGTSVVRENASLPALADAAETYLNGSGYHGVIMLEFRYDPETFEFWLIDVNPRWWGSLALPIASGHDFPAALWGLHESSGAVEIPAAPTLEPGAVQAIWVLGALFARSGSGRLTGNGASIRVFDDLYWDDPFAFVGELIDYARRFAANGGRLRRGAV